MIDTLQAGKRKGINRIYWSMQAKPPRVPSGAQASFAGTVGPRVIPGRYTVRITKNGVVYEQALELGLDRRADYTVEDRRAHFAAATQVMALFERTTDVVERINATRQVLAQRASGAKEGAARTALESYDAALDRARKQIVATTEGGAITGEERLREHLDQVYGALLGYEGRPATYLIERIAVLDREIADVEAEAKTLLSTDLERVNRALTAEGIATIAAAAVESERATAAAAAQWAALWSERSADAPAVATRAERD